ncbi:sacsin N-terminal ATP-binding-like domain-containing protein [Krasilnikovia sp. MM14-A1259]|uniref:sacsin N-terminal ATP-binding-like domain-containing protein n=1 Tax=Krasilnikovia sp. MM14-A1259 TaxID=3373539 RepID=UPI00381AB369
MDQATRLREQEFASIRLHQGEDLRETGLKILDERGGAQELIRQQYSGRYPFELLQNANDAAVDRGVRGRASFLLTETALIVADDGSGFEDKHVAAICSLGRSSKGPGTAVGHKGLGFKSVGEITDRPQIFSVETSFEFDGDRLRREVAAIMGDLPTGQRLPIYAFPFPVTVADLEHDAHEVRRLRDEGFNTVIRLPLRAGVNRQTVAEHLVTYLRPRLLLFLPGIDHLDLQGTAADFSARVTRPSVDGVERVSLHTGTSAEEWLIYRQEARPAPDVLEPLGEAWADVTTVRWAVAVPLDGAGQPRADETFPLHVYFPTEEDPGLHLMIHAEWILGMDRRQLSTAPEAQPYNEMLLDHLAASVERVATDVVRRWNASTAAVTALVPAVVPASPGAGQTLRGRWQDALSRAPFLPVADGSLAQPVDVSLLPDTLPNCSTAHDLADIDGERTLLPDIEQLGTVRSFLTGHVGVKPMSVEGFVAILRPPHLETVAAYYGFLAEWRERAGRKLVPALREVPCVLTVDGALMVAAKQPVFFPRARGHAPIPLDLPVPIAVVPEVDGAEALLNEVGVRPFEWRDLIRDFLLGILTNPDEAPELRARALAGMRAYHQVRLSESEALAPALGSVLLSARTAAGERRELRAGASLYFGEDWTGSGDLEVIYGPFGNTEFLASDPPTDSEQRRIDRAFYEMLGVRDHPRLHEAKTSDSGGYPLAGSDPLKRSTMFNAWRTQPTVQATRNCPHGHAHSQQQLGVSYRLDRHEDLIASLDRQRLEALWRQLALHWGDVYEPAMVAVFHCSQRQHSGERDRHCMSLFAHTLQSQRWLPVYRGTTAELARPGDAWISARQTHKRILERVPRISAPMLSMKGGMALANALGVTDASRPAVADLLTLLADIADESDRLGETNREIELAARWAVRALHDVLADEPPHPDPGSVRVLARHGGQTLFVAQPPYTDDPLLRETWEQRCPVLNADQRLGRLVRYLSLTRLDDAVTTTPVPYGEHFGDDVHRAVSRKIAEAKPYLLALVRAENSLSENTARNALTRLELVICDSLVLRYEHDGHSIEREDATCFIAERRSARHHLIGTAYLEVERDTGEPHWFPFGRQLAQHLGVPTLSDAITMVFTTAYDDRRRMMADRQIRPEDVNEARDLLGLADDEELDMLPDSFETSIGDSDTFGSRPEVAPGTNEAPADSPMPSGSPASSGSTAPSNVPGSPDAQKPTAQQITEVDYEQVHIVDGRLGPLDGKFSPTHPSGFGGGGAPTLQSEADKRRVGRRGEEIVFTKERARLQAAGKDPNRVVWMSKDHETAPFDIRSVDDDDQAIYIEVKATKADDPGEPFYISHAELVEAALHRHRYYIYRVTRTDSSAPMITRVADPLSEIKAGRGRLLLSQARIALGFTASE